MYGKSFTFCTVLQHVKDLQLLLKTEEVNKMDKIIEAKRVFDIEIEALKEREIVLGRLSFVFLMQLLIAKEKSLSLVWESQVISLLSWQRHLQA